jgi:CubicO group peptidase (beta-lactamase class C family)
MSPIDRRGFLAATAGLGALYAAPNSSAIDETLRTGISRRKIPCAVGMAANSTTTLYSGAFGKRDDSGAPVRIDSIFSIASMTKAITTVAALQLVDRGKVGLDEPVVKHLPQFKDILALERFDENGEPMLNAAATQPTLRHLLTHTSGLAYDTWDADMFRYVSKRKTVPGVPGPLMFEPGRRWQYGQGCDWAGVLVETISGLTLEDYFQKNILQPLGMADTSYILPAAKFDRYVSNYTRQKDGSLLQRERKQPNPPKTFNGGGGLYSTAADYIRFMQMILRDGAGILRPKTVASMKINQIGQATAGKMKSFIPETSSDVDIQPGHTEKWGLGFLINTDAYAGGRSTGSLAWAGLYNTFYWIDPKRNFCAVILMQFLPFVDKEAVGMLNDFEQAVYKYSLS